ncbi:MAG TPA: hypothetical protein PLD88_13645 [Candidatus Berkiella sp.]|nr:hypothetical protein [Candidatus Berkiella sp.]
MSEYAKIKQAYDLFDPYQAKPSQPENPTESSQVSDKKLGIF